MKKAFRDTAAQQGRVYYVRWTSNGFTHEVDCYSSLAQAMVAMGLSGRFKIELGQRETGPLTKPG